MRINYCAYTLSRSHPSFLSSSQALDYLIGETEKSTPVSAEDYLCSRIQPCVSAPLLSLDRTTPLVRRCPLNENRGHPTRYQTFPTRLASEVLELAVCFSKPLKLIFTDNNPFNPPRIGGLGHAQQLLQEASECSAVEDELSLSLPLFAIMQANGEAFLLACRYPPKQINLVINQ